jgi:hypothetical protein
MKHLLHITKKEGGSRGYILLLSILISSVILAISLGVYSIGIKQFLLSAFLSESQRALSAADRGIECFMYWDALFRDTDPLYDTSVSNSVPTVFLSSNSEVLPANSNAAVCSGQQLTSSGWTVEYDEFDPTITAPNARTRFNLSFPDDTCVNVEVFRNSSRTRVTSDGYSDCDPNNTRRTQRRLEAVAAF